VGLGYTVCMKELTLNGRTYLSTKRAAEITGYTTDYVGQLARGGKIDAQLVGRNWYIDEVSIKKHKFGEAQVSVKEEKEAPAPQLEVLVSNTEEVLEEAEAPAVEEVPMAEEAPVEENALSEMQNAWQDWYKAQKAVPTENEEVFLSEADKEVEEEKISEEVQVPITKSEPAPREEEISVEEEVEEKEVAQPAPSPLPVQRSWSGTGLVVAAALAIVFVGALTVTTGYVLTRNTDSPVAAAYQGVKDYVLGVQHFESKK